uniref:Potassium channel domain-containing protein n=1 Tax=Clytia hemisphaerica TaxID=252671 RepID=A0A7M5V2B8_9CNID
KKKKREKTNCDSNKQLLVMGVKDFWPFWKKEKKSDQTPTPNTPKMKPSDLSQSTTSASFRRSRPATAASRSVRGRDRKVTIISVRAPVNANGNDPSKSKKISDVRLQRVISEIQEFQTRSDDHLMKDTTKKAKELLWFFSIFVVYVMFGLFLFFYIEECSGASKPPDDSVLHEDVVAYPKFKNATQNCINIYKGIVVSRRINNLTDVADVRIEDFVNETFNFEKFHEGCLKIMGRALKPVVIHKAKVPKCEVNEYELLKYAEFVIFTILLIGYGNTTPQTVIGRYATIFYAIIGIPLGLTMYSVAGKLLVQLITFLIRKFESNVLKNKECVKYLYVKTVVVGICFLLVLMFLGSCVTTASNMEDLDISSSIYFWFVTWSTIGYGDITFQRDQHLKSPHLLFIAVVTLLFGLGMYVAIIEAFSSAMVKENDSTANASTFFVDKEGNVNAEEGDELSGNQQLRLQDALKKYRMIKENSTSTPSSPGVFNKDLGISNKAFDSPQTSTTRKINGRKTNDFDTAIRPFSPLSYEQVNEAFESETTDV